MKASHLEAELYDPVQRFFTEAGYTVRGEVIACDLVAMRPDSQDLVAVELKCSLNLAVIVQATERQRLGAETWIAVIRPIRRLRTRAWQQLLHLLRRLEIGLLLVDLDSKTPTVQAVLLPQPFDRAASIRRDKVKRERLQQEFGRRHGDRNRGGVCRQPIMTVYREQAVLVAALLNQAGSSATAACLRRLGGPEKTWRILHDNHYGWFERQASHQYRLTPAGAAALAEHAELAAALLSEH
jgi:hypothetical protein